MAMTSPKPVIVKEPKNYVVFSEDAIGNRFTKEQALQMAEKAAAENAKTMLIFKLVGGVAVSLSLKEFNQD